MGMSATSRLIMTAKENRCSTNCNMLGCNERILRLSLSSKASMIAAGAGVSVPPASAGLGPATPPRAAKLDAKQPRPGLCLVSPGLRLSFGGAFGAAALGSGVATLVEAFTIQ